MATHGAAGGGGGRHNKFFKVLLPGSFELGLVHMIARNGQLIPPKFAAGLAAWHNRPAKLRDGAGRSWDVDLHRDGGDDRRVYLTGSGWRAFVSANGISAGQLLVFEHHRGGCLDHHFAVDIFDASGCCRLLNTTMGGCDSDSDILSLNLKRRKLSPSSTNTTTGSSEDDVETLCRRIQRPYQLRFLDLSKRFCELLGWTSSRDVRLTLMCAGGSNRRRMWQVSVKVSAKSGGMMCAGWTEFAQDNGLALSDACVFLPLDDVQGSTALQVRVIRGTGGTASTSGSSDR
ncbi:unnamed protein product [Urochloa decumbens]|uniref:TF-B3 domain-containing protein n=1 Tax=Urochloa decumbens TaxID=240449 RepID=A0ABC8W8C5_9POAL